MITHNLLYGCQMLKVSLLQDDLQQRKHLLRQLGKKLQACFLHSMSAPRCLLTTLLRSGTRSRYRLLRHYSHFQERRNSSQPRTTVPLRVFSSLNPKSQDEDRVNSTLSQVENNAITPPQASEKQPDERPGAIGGFIRGLVGGQAVAVEDAFIAEAKEQGVELPPPVPPRNASLVPVKRRKRKEEEASESQTIRDRIFGRFAGSAFMQGAFNAKERIAERIDESDNPMVTMFRNLYDRFFAENEMAMVVREIREEDPDFKVSEFLVKVETEFVPEILGAYLRGDRRELKGCCTDEAFAMLNASIRERDADGIVMDTNILDIGDVELTAGKVLEDAPVLIVSFSTQQINCLRDRGGNVVEGEEDDIRAVYYAWAFVKEAEYEEFAPSGGGMGTSEEKDVKDETDDAKEEKEGEDKRPWKLMEMVIRGAHSTI